MARIFVLEDAETSRKALVQMLLKISGEITVDAAADLTEARRLLGSTVSFDLFYWRPIWIRGTERIKSEI